MTEQDLPLPEQLASPDQAQAVFDEVTRILDGVELQVPATDDAQLTPYKQLAVGNTSIFQYPNGELIADDPESLTLASISLRQLDSSETIFDVVQSLDGKHLRKRIIASHYRRHVVGVDLNHLAAEPSADIDEIDVLAASVARNIVGIEQDQKGWAVERALGMHRASETKASDLLKILKNIAATK